MTQNTPSIHGPVGAPFGQAAAVQLLESQPVFFFDGDFRTWSQVERRARLNSAIASQIFKHLLR